MMRNFFLRSAAKSITVAAVLCCALSLALISLSANAVNTDNRFLRGDANGDGHVSIIDVTVIQRHLVQLEALSGADMLAANVDGGDLDIADAAAIQCFLAELDDPYHINEWVGVDSEEPSAQPTTVRIKPGDNELPFLPD